MKRDEITQGERKRQEGREEIWTRNGQEQKSSQTKGARETKKSGPQASQLWLL